MSDNVTFIDVEGRTGTITYAVIDRGNGEFTQMLKADYEAQQAAQAQPQG
jgi:hypothetical protein